MNNSNSERNDVFFTSDTNISLHREHAEKEGLTMEELHWRHEKDKYNQYFIDIRKEHGYELIPAEEFRCLGRLRLLIYPEKVLNPFA